MSRSALPRGRQTALSYTAFSMSERRPKELESAEGFEVKLREEISVSEEFDLPLSVLVLEGSWDVSSTRRVLDSVRAADLVAKLETTRIAVALPNTVPGDARVVEQRLREAVPEAAVRLTERRTGDGPGDLLERARRSGAR